MPLRASPGTYASDAEAVASRWKLLGYRCHVQLPSGDQPGYGGLARADGGKLAVTHRQWAMDRPGLSLGDGPRFGVCVHGEDLDATVPLCTAAGVEVLRDAEDKAWGERIATVADPDGNPVAPCQTKPER